MTPPPDSGRVVAADPAAAALGAPGRLRAPGGRTVARRSARLRTALLVAWDVAAALLACAAAAAAASGAVAGVLSRPQILVALCTPPALAAARAYERRPDAGWGLVGRLALASTLAVWVPSLVDDRWGGGQEALLWLLLPPAWLLGRVLLDLTRRRRPEAVLIVGGGEVAARIATLMERERRERSRIVGCVDDDPPWANEGLPLLGGIDDLPRALQDHQVDRVVVTFSRRRDADSLRVLQACDDFGVDVDVVPRMFDLVGHAPRSYTLGGLALLNVRGQRPSPYQRFGKRSFDLLVAGGALLVLAPLFAATALAIALDDGRPVFFRQRRVGRGVQPFTILKFRTMAAAEAVGTGARPGPDRGTPGIADVVRLRKDDAAPRVTRVGRHLRHTSLDELPQLLNVVRGDMSLVGPRPLQSYEVEALDSWQERRQQMRPGITGLWQVLGRSDINWDERMQLDYSYVRHWSIASDLRILAGTLPAVVSRRGAV